MFARLKSFTKVMLRWGTGVILTLLGFQTIYSLLLVEME